MMFYGHSNYRMTGVNEMYCFWDIVKFLLRDRNKLLFPGRTSFYFEAILF